MNPLPSPPVTIELVGYISSSVTIAILIVIWVTTRFSQIRSALDAHKLHAAETFATKQSVNDGFSRLEGKVDRVSDKIDHLLLNNKDD